MPHANAQDTIDVLDQREVLTLDQQLLGLFAAIEGDLLGSLNETRVGVTQRTGESCLLGRVLAKRRSKRAN